MQQPELGRQSCSSKQGAPAAEVVEAVEDGAVLAHVELDELRLQRRIRRPFSSIAYVACAPHPSMHSLQDPQRGGKQACSSSALSGVTRARKLM